MFVRKVSDMFVDIFVVVDVASIVLEIPWKRGSRLPGNGDSLRVKINT